VVEAPPAEVTAARVDSSDGVAVALHHLAARPSARPLLISHATGFHGVAYTPLAAALADVLDVWALDHRGHGVTTAPAGWDGRWDVYGDDAEAAAMWVAEHAGQPPAGDRTLVGFGHSMGGATLLMTADRHPDLFGLLVLFEPVVPVPGREVVDPEASPLVAGARRRRRQFDSAAAARQNFASKPPMADFVPAALDAYVTGGFTAVDATRPDGPVRLRCSPEVEAATFTNGSHHDTWERLTHIAVPTVVVAGPGDGGPADSAPAIADRLPHGQFELHAELDHFGPFTSPDRVAAIVRSAIENRVALASSADLGGDQPRS
jgi:pimeloyl-ACP methyl ester carboxylesterase